MCLQGDNHPPIAHVIDDYEHGVIDRRTFLRKATALLGLSAATLLVQACSPQTTTQQSTAKSSGPAPAPAVPAFGTVTPDDADITAQDITYPSDGGTQVKAYLARPKATGTYPAIIVIHENRGLTPHQKDLARRYANAGFVALAVDLLSRQGGTDKFAQPQDATAAIGQTKDDELNADLNAAVKFLKAHEAVKGSKVGVTGHCWGGGRTKLLAIRNSEIAASVPYYGPAPQNLDEVKGLAGPMLAIYAGNDQRINAGIPPFEAKLKEFGKTYEIKMYDGANHAFFNDTGANFKADAAADSWTQTVNWFNKHLRS